jgi:hypothetical protein
MNSAGARDRNLQTAEYLQLLRALAVELERAMEAIANNDLADLEESVVNQEGMSAKLSALVNDICVPLYAEPSPSYDSDGDNVMNQIQMASKNLQKLNQRYAALLQYSSRSVALMVSLFNSVNGKVQEASGPRLKYQTWSCRM